MARLPIEVIETIIDFLQNDIEALKQCCLASKSLIARTRSHLFKHVSFWKPTDLQKWKERFGDLENTPAIFITHLDIRCELVAGKDLSAFHKLLPHVKSLTMIWDRMESQEVFHFICSFPSLEDLDVFGGAYLYGTAGGPLSLPKLTGTISFRCYSEDFIRQFLELSGDLRFREIVVNISGVGDSARELVKRCSGTLERISIQSSKEAHSKSRPHSPAHNRLRI